VVKLPFTDPNSAGWDLSSGPDLFFILKKTNLVVVDASTNYISDVVESMLPAYWTFTSPYQIDDWAGEHYFELYDWDASGDDYIGKTESFKINNVVLEGYENNITVTSTDGKIEFVVDVLWK